MRKSLCNPLCNAYVVPVAESDANNQHQYTMSNNNNNTEADFVQFINANGEEVKALAALNAMTESEKLELIKQFMADK